LEILHKPKTKYPTVLLSWNSWNVISIFYKNLLLYCTSKRSCRLESRRTDKHSPFSSYRANCTRTVDYYY
jgi:hypothetical protein